MLLHFWVPRFLGFLSFYTLTLWFFCALCCPYFVRSKSILLIVFVIIFLDFFFLEMIHCYIRIETEWNQTVSLFYMLSVSYNGLYDVFFIKAGRLSASFTFGNRMLVLFYIGTTIEFWNSGKNCILFLVKVSLLDLNWRTILAYFCLFF